MRRLTTLAITSFVTVAAIASHASAGETASANRSTASAPQAQAPYDWTILSETCEKGGDAYEQYLKSFRSQMQEELKAMKTKEYDELELKDDPKLIFVSATWPGDLSEHDEFWKTYKDCADLHFAVRKVLVDTSAGIASKQNKVDEFKKCLLVRYEHKRLMPPLDRLITCYQKKAAH